MSKVEIFRSDSCAACRALVPQLESLLKNLKIQYTVTNVEKCGQKCSDIRYVPEVKVNDKIVGIEGLIRMIRAKKL